jgi:hypothetical protein
VRWVAAAGLVVLAACGSGPREEKPDSPPVVRVVDGDYESVTVRSGGEARSLPVGDLVPLLAARSFAPVEPLEEYGLDKPVARLVFRPSGPTVLVGGVTVDEAFRYVMVAGDEETIHTVPSDVFTPLL